NGWGTRQTHGVADVAGSPVNRERVFRAVAGTQMTVSISV
ncbi:hypothetical protein CSUI_007356, partial [Cystoisospora suis]